MMSMLLGALVGAFSFSIFVVFFQGYQWIERSSESGGLPHNLVMLGLLIFESVLLTPWGILGGLVGMGVIWLLFSRRRP